MVFQDPQGSLDPRSHRRQQHSRAAALPRSPVPGAASGPCASPRSSTRSDYRPRPAGLYPHQFSGGQRQRIAIARALVTAPRLVVADEPTSALDLSIQAQVLNLILDLNRDRGTAFLFISHNLGAVGAVAERVAVMFRGRIVETGPAPALPRRPAASLCGAARRSRAADRGGRVSDDRTTDHWDGIVGRDARLVARLRLPLALPARRGALRLRSPRAATAFRTADRRLPIIRSMRRRDPSRVDGRRTSHPHGSPRDRPD